MKNNEVLMDAIGEIREDMVWDARPQARVRRFTVRRALILAAALAMCFALAVTGMAAADANGVYEALYRVSPEIAQRLKPVRMTCEDEGIRMEVLSASVSGNTVEAYIALQDLNGDRIDETTDMNDSYRIQSAVGCESHCRQISFDSATRTATYLLTMTWPENQNIAGKKITFIVGSVISGKQRFEENIPVDLSGVAASVQTQTGMMERGSGCEPGCEEMIPHEVLVPEILASPVEGVALTGIGYVGDLLHVQLRYDDILTMDNHGYVRLVDAAGEETISSAELDFWGDNGESYTEYVFEIAPEKLAECALYGWFETSDVYVEGGWEVTFSAEAAQ